MPWREPVRRGYRRRQSWRGSACRVAALLRPGRSSHKQDVSLDAPAIGCRGAGRLFLSFACRLGFTKAMDHATQQSPTR
jgi:hypothetical protein